MDGFEGPIGNLLSSSNQSGSEVNISPYAGTPVPALFSFSRAVIFKSGCFVQKYWSGTVTRNIKENMTWIQ